MRQTINRHIEPWNGKEGYQPARAADGLRAAG